MLPYLKKGSFLGQKTAGGGLGTSHMAFREKGIFFGPQKTAGGSLGTSHLAFKDDPREHAGDGPGEHAGDEGESMLVMRERAC